MTRVGKLIKLRSNVKKSIVMFVIQFDLWSCDISKSNIIHADQTLFISYKWISSHTISISKCIACFACFACCLATKRTNYGLPFQILSEKSERKMWQKWETIRFRDQILTEITSILKLKYIKWVQRAFQRICQSFRNVRIQLWSLNQLGI